ncbi:MAG: protease inhibitor I42 family protein [Armatimonadetes bacterium]|nr:protease inhibitor I42 family protein [Armatimonadota bacterium]
MENAREARRARVARAGWHGGLAVTGMVWLSACGSLEATPPAALVFQDADSGRTVGLSPGQQLVLRLSATPSTGFLWQTATAPSAAVLTSVSSTFEPPTGGGLGAGGTQVITFQAAATGRTALRLVYVRPFDPSVVAREFTLTIQVG